MSKYLSILFSCFIFSVCFAQQKGASLLLPSLAPAQIKTNTLFLTWTSSESKFAIYTGTSRTTLTNRQVIGVNKYPLTNNINYGVAAINMAGIESTLAYWPSNRVFELWLRGYGTNLNQFTNVAKLATCTNIPPGQMYFWGVADITTRWE